MKFTRRHFTIGAAATATALACPAIAQNAPMVIKFSHVAAEDTPKGKGANKFKELAEKYTQGKVKIEHYPNSQLYKDKEEIEALQLGAVQLLAPSTAKFAPLGAKEFEALDLPFLYRDDAHFQKIAAGPVGKYLMGKLEPHGVKGLGFWDNGFYYITSNRALVKPADFKGLKVRISGSKIADQYFRAVGGIPQILAFSEVYHAMQTGVVDAGENSASNIFTQKFHEVQSHVTGMHHGHLQYAVITNAKFWAGLPADIRTQLEKAMNEANVYTNSIALQENIDAMEDIKKSGKTTVRILTPEEAKPWREAMMPVYKWAEGRVGKEILDLIQKEAAAV
ncbi:MAG: DctP family TRAP transporter solute-binding subunit [Alphaproteobacteria bacterium]|nr:DctP family TRAP transporter solute-binding subunit [Alphaproteobacteria bacterium]